MTREISRPRPAGWPLGLMGMLAIVAVVEWGINVRSHADLGTMYSIEWDMTGRSIKRMAPGSEILCFGTSLTRLGVSPIILQDRLGLSAYNFGLSGAQPIAAYTALRHALDAGAKPKAIVVEFKWSAIAMGYTWNERVLPEMATLRDCAEFASVVRDASFFARLVLVKKLPSFRCREEIRSNIMAAVRGEEPRRNYERSIMRQNALVNRGGNHTPRGSFDGTVRPDDPDVFPADWHCDPTSELYINRLLDLAESRGIGIFWLIPPLPPATQRRRDELGAEDRYTGFIKKLTAAHPGISVVDARYSKYGNEAFFDMTHLNRDGAVALTGDLADVIAARLSAPKQALYWACLPDYRPSPDAKKVEDLADSLASLHPSNNPKAKKR